MLEDIQMAAVLVVDDEPVIREMLMLILERGGFAVVSAANGVEGLHKYRQYKDDIELVICDVTMPETDGPNLVKRLLRDQPELPIIIMSDHCDSIDLGSQQNLRFIPKPFSLSTLLSTVRSLISKRESFSTSSA